MSGTQEKRLLESAQSAKARTGIKKEKLTQERLKELLRYDKKTGEFSWRISSGSVRKKTVAGCDNGKGYTVIRINRTGYKAHRLAWLYVNGYFPENEIDHIDRDKSNNRIENLREVSRSCNMRNSPQFATNNSGITGIHWFKPTCRWAASITVFYKRFHLGLFDRLEDAAVARWEAEKKYDFPNCNTKSSAYVYLKKHGLV